MSVNNLSAEDYGAIPNSYHPFACVCKICKPPLFDPVVILGNHLALRLGERNGKPHYKLTPRKSDEETTTLEVLRQRKRMPHSAVTGHVSGRSE